MKCFMGIDAGTSGVKVVIFDETGAVRGTGHRECDIITPRPGWVEQDPNTWWDACCSAVRQAVLKSGCGKDVAGIGFSGQMQGCALMDRDFNPIGNCLIWLDQRAGAEAAAIDASVPAENYLGITANLCLNSFWAPKLLWLKNNRPADYDRAHKVFFAKDFIRYRMTGEAATDVSDASLSFLMDVPGRKWSREMFRLLDIPMDLAPDRLAESCEVVGCLRADVAADWGMNAFTPVVAGGGDQPAGGVGTGIIRPGVMGATIGTSGVVFGCTAEPFVDTQRRSLLSMAHAVPDMWCFLGLVLSAGGAFKWLRNTFFAEKKAVMDAAGADIYDYMTGLAAGAQPGCEGLTFLPYLNGEKTPYCDENARGVFFGLSQRHGIGDICRSVMEGVAFALRDTFEICRGFGQDITEVRLNGGGAKSALWRQIQADIYNASVVTMNMEEGPAAGGAIMAAVGAGHFASVGEACGALLKIRTRTDPIPQNVALYDEYYGVYGQLYADLRETFEKQAGIVGGSLKSRDA